MNADEITIEENDQQLVIRLPAEFVFSIYRDFRDSYRKSPSGLHYELDLRRVNKIDSAALGMLLMLKSHCGDERADLVLTNCNPGVKQFLELARFDQQFRIA